LGTETDEAVAVIRSVDTIESGVASMAAHVVGGLSRRR
jgi:hypothetical protein